MKSPDSHKDIARERVEILFRLAGEEFKTRPDRSNLWVRLARRIAMRYQIKIPPQLKRSVCSRCHSYIVPGKNCTVRTDSRTKSVQAVCRECGNVMRHPYTREKHAR